MSAPDWEVARRAVERAGALDAEYRALRANGATGAQLKEALERLAHAEDLAERYVEIARYRH